VELHAGELASTSRRPATGAPVEVAVTVNPGGAALTASPWLIHTDCSTGSEPNSRPCVVTVSGVPPYSRSPVRATGAAERGGHRLEPVADAERRDAGLEQRRVELRRVVGVDARRATGEDDRRGLAGDDLLGRDVGGTISE
jgi:hypothetical protein